MHKTILMAAVWAGLMPVAAMAAPAGDIPPAFHGDWSGRVEACGKADDDSRTHVAAHDIGYYEDGDEVLGVTVVDAHHIVVDVNSGNDGRTSRLTRHLTLSPDGRRLTITGGVKPFTVVRCPAAGH